MTGHDPLLILLILVLTGIAVGYIQHHWPLIGASIDVAGKVLLAVVGVLLFVDTASGENPPQTGAPTPGPAATSPAHPGNTSAAPAPSATTPATPPGN
ncbi:hypothetical protein LUX12_21490 [Streptomyces somaliensis]|uniref:hypothetical protein n=1 Tax=Streptomyces somaliensis TaxID=78355 RepID=UPI0020CE2E6F|nr:hypothetical protein [Streptomyces somaliensis]MCP9946786.1 hypothetical protein [Streptomyces somaliensis]